VIRLLLLAGVLIAPCLGRAPVVAAAVAGPLSAEPGLAAECAQVRNDDTVRPYDPSLRAGLLAAYGRLFPRARTPDEQALQAGAHIRCMNGRLLGCFSGANMPCGKLNMAPDNQGAAAFCSASPNAEIVPAYATGEDAGFLYRCAGGQAEISGDTFLPDARGFAVELWAPID
jgi:hypothetical protein